MYYLTNTITTTRVTINIKSFIMNNNNIQAFLQKGKLVEEKFKNAIILSGREVRDADVQTDIHDHIDVFFKEVNNDKEYGVDIKAMKRVNRLDKDATATMTYLEIKNVRGNLGWAYGKAHYIAFDMGDHFLLVRTSNIRSWIAANVEKIRVSSASRSHKKLYTRIGRKDCITMILRHELEEIASAKLYYDGTITLV